MIASPERGCSGQGIEIIERQKAGCGFVVIAADENFSQLERAVNHFVGRRAVADDISEIGHKVVGRGRCEAGLERFQIGVNVA